MDVGKTMDVQLFHKTESGRNEIVSRQLKLPARVRRLLILIDGSKTIEELNQLAGQGENIQPLLQQLYQAGLIIPAGYPIKEGSAQLAPAAEPAPAPVIQPTAAPAVIDATDLAEIKNWMLDGCQQYLGIMGSDIRRRIETATDDVSLRKCVAPWIMALRDSKTGHTVADAYLSMVHARIG